jgi:hypothetical protein
MYLQIWIEIKVKDVHPYNDKHPFCQIINMLKSQTKTMYLQIWVKIKFNDVHIMLNIHFVK